MLNLNNHKHLRLAKPQDALTLAPKLRKEDAEEIYQVSRMQPESGLLISIMNAKVAYTMFKDDPEEPVGVFGVTAHNNSKEDFIWALGTDALVKNPKLFLEESQRALKIIANYFPNNLITIADSANKRHLRWLKWMGFERVGEVEQHGLSTRPFIKFKYKPKEAPNV